MKLRTELRPAPKRKQPKLAFDVTMMRHVMRVLQWNAPRLQAESGVTRGTLWHALTQPPGHKCHAGLGTAQKLATALGVPLAIIYCTEGTLRKRERARLSDVAPPGMGWTADPLTTAEDPSAWPDVKPGPNRLIPR